jgi:hypothetical protein
MATAERAYDIIGGTRGTTLIFVLGTVGVAVAQPNAATGAPIWRTSGRGLFVPRAPGGAGPLPHGSGRYHLPVAEAARLSLKLAVTA